MRTFFTLLALVVAGIPLVGLVASSSLRWGTVPEWIGALALVLIAVGVWRLAHDHERATRDRQVRR